LSDTFLIQNGIKKGEALLLLFFKFALEDTIGNVQVNQVGLKLHGRRQLVIYADANFVIDNINTIKKMQNIL
jgi:hypothetical protein